jgi:hypothetical protein
MGKFLVIVGLVIAALGVLLWLAPNALSWFGRLPGDIRIERENTRVYIPLASMLLISLILTLLMNLLRRG